MVCVSKVAVMPVSLFLKPAPVMITVLPGEPVTGFMRMPALVVNVMAGTLLGSVVLPAAFMV